jgi:hypothetical protein
MTSSSQKKISLLKEDLSRLLNCMLEEFPVQGFFFLHDEGFWQESPQNWPERVQSEILFWLKKENESERKKWLEVTTDFIFIHGFSLLEKVRLALRSFSWPLEKMAISFEELRARHEFRTGLGEFREGKNSSLDYLLSFIDCLTFLVLQEALQINLSFPYAEWDSQARAINFFWQKKLEQLKTSLASGLSPEEIESFFSLSRTLKDCSGDFVDNVAGIIAEEQRLATHLNQWLQKLEEAQDKEAIYASLRDRLQPPLGIVTHVTPAFFYPAVAILLHPEIDVSSGLPYLASLIISLFKDSRASDYLLFALKSFPPFWTKIRENIIYCLGNLREARAVPWLKQVLELPDILESPEASEAAFSPLREQKEEAIWALGKIGFASSQAINLLASYADHPSARLKTYLAWSLGEIGRSQREKTGGISADILIALLKLLKEKNKEVFEETVSALKKIQMPEFIHSLYLYHVGAVNLLSLKPAEVGLNELSLTLNHLLQEKKRVVMAVTGDSGTGKTYFCQVLASGLADLKPGDILYLMRDSKEGRKIFNRLLGRNWLKKYIDPLYYQQDIVESDRPEDFWQQFLETYGPKRFILLDGCRDRHYFERIVDLFYERGELDVVVNFRANLSTRRLNLEAREVALESVKLHLSFLEEPSIEDTFLYQEGKIILYDLDNSISGRLNREETAELFRRRAIEGWGELIRLGHFEPESFWSVTKEEIEIEEKEFSLESATWPESSITPLLSEEEILEPRLNQNLDQEPHLLSTFFLDQLEPERLYLYAQNQIGGVDKKGKFFVFTLIDYRLFTSCLQTEVRAEALLGRNFCFQEKEPGLTLLSFEREQVIKYNWPARPILRLAALPPWHLFMILQDGALYLWDFEEQKISHIIFPWGKKNLINSMAIEPGHRLYLASEEEIFHLDLNKGKISRTRFKEGLIQAIEYLPRNKLLVIFSDQAKEKAGLKIVDFEQRRTATVRPEGIQEIKAARCLQDGRLIIGGQEIRENQGEKPGLRTFLSLLIPEKNFYGLARINRQEYKINDLVAFGPRILTCGQEPDGQASFRIWGSRFFVRTELSKLKIKA